MIDENIQAFLREFGRLELSTRAAAFLQQKIWKEIYRMLFSD